MAKYVYPAVFTKEGGVYSVIFPDLESCYTQGDSVQDAFDMASDVLCLTLYELEENKKTIPAPSDPGKLKTQKSEFVALVSCDTLEYRRFFDNRAVKKTLTIPAWLNTMSEREGVNFSAILQRALKAELKITDR